MQARQLHMLYQYGIKLRQESTTEVAGRNVMEMCIDGLMAANDAQRLGVSPSYVPKQPDNSRNRRRRGWAGRRRKQRGANPDDVSPMEDANPNVEPDCGTSTRFTGENLNDEAQFGMGSSPCDDVSGSHYTDNHIVIYNAESSPMDDANPDVECRSSHTMIHNVQPLRQFANEDVGYATPARPDHVQSMNDDLNEQASSFRGSTSSISLPSSPTPSTPQIPISWPEDGTLTLTWVRNLMLAFDWASRNLPPSDLLTVLPIEVFDRLAEMASGIMHKEPNCLQIDSRSGLDPNSTVVVVGDVHGQLHVVLFLLKDAGFPSENRFFVFNGDYVDRGAWGLETFLLLLAWKVRKFTSYF